MRILYEQFANIQKMGPMSAVMSMIPGFGGRGPCSSIAPDCLPVVYPPPLLLPPFTAVAAPALH